ncbi:phage scaffolding protein [Swingsia samuiensis]|nr:phage scaffolding protein [Swingsia samuiensis]
MGIPQDLVKEKECDGMDEDVEELRVQLKQAQHEIEVSKSEINQMLAQREETERVYTEKLAQINHARDQDAIMAELRTQAIKLGAHNPEDVVKLIDKSTLTRDENGVIMGAQDVLERARKERAYLFNSHAGSGRQSGTTVSAPSPQPGEPVSFDARRISGADYEAQKWQFLAKK